MKERFDSDHVFDNKQIISFYRSIEPSLNESTVNWRIYCLVQSSVLTRIGRGKFIFGSRKNYKPDLPQKLKTLNNKLRKNFPYLDYCL